MRIESNRDWHRIFGNHTEECLFDEDVEQLMVPATPDQLILMVECWNDRAKPATAGGMKKVRGDLIALFKAGQFDVIVHGQNCGCNMDDGIAKTIALEFPEAFQADLQTRPWDRSKLGTYSQARVAAGVVVNAYVQFHFNGLGPNGGPLTDYNAMRSVFRALRQEFGGRSLRFGVPAIGAARAGGDWLVISAIIDEELAGEDVTFVEFDGVDALSGDYRKNIGRWARPPLAIREATATPMGAPAIVYQFKAVSGEWVEVSQEQYDGWVRELAMQGLCERRPLSVIATGDSALRFSTFAPGDTDQNEDGTWTAGIHVGTHGNKIEVHDANRETAEALRDAICTALNGKVTRDEPSRQVTLPQVGN
jgi:O-acetyl-ADP-ribose deacetylase (regulator of RNase III)